MATSCCITRNPPSPDGLAPRIAPDLSISSAEPNRTIPKNPFSSLSQVSRLSNPADELNLEAIFAEDKSMKNSEPDCVKSKKSTSTLKVVKSKLKKHLSRDSGVSKRLSRCSVGTSEEEIERRAELRRLRHKRIQEELSNEGIYDDDAHSISTIGRQACSRNDHSDTWKYGEFIPMPELTLPESNPLAVEIPKLRLASLSSLPPIPFSCPTE